MRARLIVPRFFYSAPKGRALAPEQARNACPQHGHLNDTKIELRLCPPACLYPTHSSGDRHTRVKGSAMGIPYNGKRGARGRGRRSKSLIQQRGKHAWGCCWAGSGFANLKLGIGRCCSFVTAIPPFFRSPLLFSCPVFYRPSMYPHIPYTPSSVVLVL